VTDIQSPQSIGEASRERKREIKLPFVSAKEKFVFLSLFIFVFSFGEESLMRDSEIWVYWSFGND
jgi:hypothetical protein